MTSPNNQKRGPRFSGGLINIPLFAVYAFGTWALVWRHAIRDSHGDIGGAILQLLPTVGLTLAFLTIIFAWGALLGRRLNLRAAALSESQPHAIVMRVVRPPELIRAIQTAGIDRQFDIVARDLPLYLELMGNARGLQVWGGTPKSPFKYFSIPWRRVADLQFTLVQERGRTSAGILVSVLPGRIGEAAELPIIVVGRGFGGMFPLKRNEIYELLRQLVELKGADDQKRAKRTAQPLSTPPQPAPPQPAPE